MAIVTTSSFSSGGETNTQKNGYLRTAKQRAKYNK